MKLKFKEAGVPGGRGRSGGGVLRGATALDAVAVPYQGPYIGNLSLAYVSGRPNRIEEVGPEHPLAGIGARLIRSLDRACLGP